MKKLLALGLALALCLGLFAGCGAKEEDKPDMTAPTEPEDTTAKDDGILRILVLGHSLGMDSIYLLPAIMEAEGMTDFEIGQVYGSYSSTLQRKWFTTGAKKYTYREYTYGQDTTWRRADCNGNFLPSIPGEANDTLIADGTIAQPMEFGIERRDWDIVIMMASSREQPNVLPATDSYAFNADNFNAWRDFVLEHDIDKTTKPKFAFHMVWSCTNDQSMYNDARWEFVNTYYADSEQPDLDIYKDGVNAVKEYIVPMGFDYILPTGTAMQNAKSVMFGRDLYRDSGHASDYGRLIAGYTWFCMFTGKDIRECKIGPFHYEDMLDQSARLLKKPVELTQLQKDVLVESVYNAINNPFETIPSQYTK